MLVFHNCTMSGLLENAQNQAESGLLQLCASDIRNLV
jgi:hypothetical protein